MKLLFTILSLFYTTIFSYAQVTNWTALDCQSTPHTFFDELDGGKTIVLVWNEPCAGCVDGTIAVNNVVKNIRLSHPGKVLFYIIDDGPPSDCSTLATWLVDRQLNPDATFGNYNNEIDQFKYTGLGMPHIVVISSEHKLYYDELNGTGVDVDKAIIDAINHAPSGIANIANEKLFTIAPNPATENISVYAAKPVQAIAILSLNGSLIKEQQYQNTTLNPSINLSGMAKGVFLMRITTADKNIGLRSFIKE